MLCTRYERHEIWKSNYWRKICPDIEEEDCLNFVKQKFTAAKLAAILKDMPGCENVDSDNILEWFAVECTKLGCIVLSDSETVRWAQEQSRETDECSEDEYNYPPHP
jgi:hypothetical protein